MSDSTLISKNSRHILKNTEICTGCAACISACPKGAIQFRDDDLGFSYPEITAGNCVECGKCLRSCPVAGLAFLPETADEPEAYAAWAHDDIRKASSSGGVFSLIATEVLRAGGVVYGAAFDANWRVGHRAVERTEELSLLRTSKYVQSEMCRLDEVRERLEKGQRVLFSGTPCQVAGLHGFLGREYDALLTVDILCHGAPAPVVFAKYLREKITGPIRAVNFRDKSNGWKKLCIRIDGDDGGYSAPHDEDPFMRGFLRNLFLRDCCHACQFARVARVADLSLGDYWGIKRYSRKYDDDRGVSLILVNTQKGAAALAAIAPQLPFCRRTPLKIAVRGNPILHTPATRHGAGKMFRERFPRADKVSGLILDCLGDNDVGILNFHQTNNNYGAALVGFAMARAVGRLGGNPVLINYVHERERLDLASVFEDFRRDFLVRTEVCRNMSDLFHINRRFPRIIAGGDQVWAWTNDYIYSLCWAHGDKTLLSYAPSFARDRLDWKKSKIRAMRRYLQRLDFVSVREKSGVRICREEFGVKAEQVLDPVLLLSDSDLEEIIRHEKVETPDDEYVAFMVLDGRDYDLLRRAPVMGDLKRRYRLVDVRLDRDGKPRSFSHWLALLKNAKYVATGSFHGCVLSLLFEKQFVVTLTKKRGNERFFSLFDQLEIPRSRILPSLAEVDEKSFAARLDYRPINAALARERERSLAFLRTALAHPTSYKKPVWHKSYIGSLFKWLPNYQGADCAKNYLKKLFK